MENNPNIRVTVTHNPQDWYSGLEPETISEVYPSKKLNLGGLLPKLLGGYKIILEVADSAKYQ